MIHRTSHPKKGFTLLEVLIAIALIGIVVTPLFITQGNILQSTLRASHRLTNFFTMSLFLKENEHNSRTAVKAPSNTTMQQQTPPLVITYEITDELPNEQLKQFPHIFLQKTDGIWRRGITTYKETIVSFLFKPTGAS